MAMCRSPSAEMPPLGKMYCQSLENFGNCAFASDEIATLSASHNPAMNAISARVLVMTVVPHKTWGAASQQPIMNARPTANTLGRKPSRAVIWHILRLTAFMRLLMALVFERGATDAAAQKCRASFGAHFMHKPSGV